MLGNAVDAYLLRLGKAVRQASDATFLRDQVGYGLSGAGVPSLRLTFYSDSWKVSAPGRSPAFMAAAVAVNELAEEGIDGLVRLWRGGEKGSLRSYWEFLHPSSLHSHYRHTQAFSSDLADVEANLQRKYKDVLVRVVGLRG